MEAALLQRTFDNLGLELLFAEVRPLVGSEAAKPLNGRDVRAFEDLSKFLGTAIGGLQLIERQGPGYGALATLNDEVKAERAYLAIRPILPEEPAKAQGLLKALADISTHVTTGEKLHPDDCRKLHSFCRDVISHLDRERFEALRDPRNLWP